ncbi:uronate dehydrogenase [Antarctobacter heliothermus]|uniref:Uronate dehydrogenase n=1 Tax=Antarctobacter heliothermus TaxID=74033 RepID=A0A222E7L3_9RHOB|nr:NAD(P)-dependent oxidoreductase [Antarctobacter heliothermus]ASP22187.1 uronate dehydrogenase [Antarctobacter heliothermus]|tara:strand:+ start:210 stop:1022 length:813 start_codon:yes stop_codon:yes gene_type:complete
MHPTSKMNRLLITGAAGGLGHALRSRLSHLAHTIRLSDVADLGDAAPHEEIVPCDLADKAAVDALVEGCDGIVHFGGKSIEGTWEVIRDSNIEGVYNLYEAARKHGHPRIVFASSNHAVGFYRQDQVIDNTVYPQPDGLYGVSKVFGEMMASAYWNKFGQETAVVRIGSSFDEPKTHRMLSSWMSYGDFVSLIERVFDVPRLGCPVIYGVSDNDTVWWDNTKVAWLGWRPQDNSETFRAKLDASEAKFPGDAPDVVYQGGSFTADGIHEK